MATSKPKAFVARADRLQKTAVVERIDGVGMTYWYLILSAACATDCYTQHKQWLALLLSLFNNSSFYSVFRPNNKQSFYIVFSSLYEHCSHPQNTTKYAENVFHFTQLFGIGVSRNAPPVQTPECSLATANAGTTCSLHDLNYFVLTLVFRSCFYFVHSGALLFSFIKFTF